MMSLLRIIVIWTYPALIPWVLLPVADSLTLGWVDIVFFPSFLAFVLVRSSRINLITLSIFLFLTFAVVSISQMSGSREKAMGLLRCGRLLMLFFPLIVASSLNIKQDDLTTFLKVFFFSTAGSVAFGLATYFLGWQVVETTQKFRVGTIMVERVGGLYGNTGTFGHMAALLLSLGIFGTHLWCRPRYRLLVKSTAAALGLSALAYSSSRGGTLNFLAFACIYLLLNRGIFHGVRRFVFGATASILLVGILLYIDLEPPRFSSDTMLERSIGRFFPTEERGAEKYSSGRLEKWSQMLKGSDQHFLIGLGYKNVSRIFNAPIDNFLLLTFVEMGIMGTASYCLMIAVVVWSLSRWYSVDPRLSSLGLALFLATLLNGMTADIWTRPTTSPLVLATLGIIYARQRSLASESPEYRKASRGNDMPEIVLSGTIEETPSTKDSMPEKI